MPKSTPPRVTVNLTALRMREAGITPEEIRGWLIYALESNPPRFVGWVWRVVFDDAGRFTVITVDREISGDDIVMTPWEDTVYFSLGKELPALNPTEEVDRAIDIATGIVRREGDAVTAEDLQERLVAMGIFRHSITVNLCKTTILRHARKKAGLSENKRPGRPPLA